MKTTELTVLMLVQNDGKYIRAAIDSTLKQSFSNFELFIIDSSSDDAACKVVKTYADERIRYERRDESAADCLNYGLQHAAGRYIARMDAMSIMHQARLQVQLKRMKTNPALAVCATWIQPFKTDGSPVAVKQSFEYLVEQPVLQFLAGNFVSPPTIMLDRRFLYENNLQYESYPLAEDYKLMFETAKIGGDIFIEPQKLLYCRLTEPMPDMRAQMQTQTARIRNEILTCLVQADASDSVQLLYSAFGKLKVDSLIYDNDIFDSFFNLFRNKQKKGTLQFITAV
jgi:glycosyltransferase involved in cell wall biosynthesis